MVEGKIMKNIIKGDVVDRRVILLQPHPVSERTPLLTDDEFEALKSSIQANGLLEPVKVLGSLVVDGRHRLRVFKELGVEFIPTLEINEEVITDEKQLLNIVMSSEAGRDLSQTQNGIMAHKYYMDLRGTKDSVSLSDAAKFHKVSKPFLDNIKMIYGFGNGTMDFRRKVNGQFQTIIEKEEVQKRIKWMNIEYQMDQLWKSKSNKFQFNVPIELVETFKDFMFPKPTNSISAILKTIRAVLENNFIPVKRTEFNWESSIETEAGSKAFSELMEKHGDCVHTKPEIALLFIELVNLQYPLLPIHNHR